MGKRQGIGSALLAVVLTACGGGGGGGGGGAASVTASFQSGSVSPETEAGVTLEVMLHVPWGELAEDVELAIIDRGTGSATSGTDYQALDTLTVTFTEGSLDGAMETVIWLPIDDGTSEGNETVDLELVRTADEGQSVIGTGSLSILDDESATLVVAKAARGGTLLTHGSTLDLGNQTIGVPTDTGIDVWIDNIGATSLRVSAPVLSGSAASFHLELGENTTAAAAHATDPVELPFPLFAIGSAASADPSSTIPLVPSDELLEELASSDRAVLIGVPVPGAPPLDVELERIPLPVRPGAVLAVDGVEDPGGVERLVGDLSLWSGHVVGDLGAQVFLAFSEHGSRGWIRPSADAEDTLHIVPHASDPRISTLALGAGLAAAGIEPPGEVCSGVLEIPGLEGAGLLAPAATDPEDRHTPYTCRLALETDYPFYELFGDATALATYVTELVGAISNRFDTDVGTSFEIAYLGIHTTSDDPWSTPATSDVENLLVEFRNAWAPMYGGTWPVSADLAHFMSGAPIGGGIAFVNALCNENYAFGVSTGLSGSVDWGSWDGGSSAMYWDFDVIAHEIGHGFNARHTHQYCPPLDTCALSCQGQFCGRGTIMSYCHACPGGVANVDLEFHPQIANEMRLAVNQSCLSEAQLAPGEATFFRVFFRPESTPGRHVATLELTHDALSAPSPYRITLEGEAETTGSPARAAE